MANSNDVNISIGLDESNFIKDLEATKRKLESFKKSIESGSGKIEAKLGVSTEQALKQVDEGIKAVNEKIKAGVVPLAVEAVKGDKSAAANAQKEAERILKGQEAAAQRGIALEQRQEEATRKTSQAKVTEEVKAAKAREALRTSEDRIYNDYLSKQVAGVKKAEDDKQKAYAQTEAKLNKALNFKAARAPIDNFKAIESAAIANAFGVDKSTYALERFAGQLPRLRYAMYDVSNSLAIVGAATLALPVASASFAISYERDFANVVRTTGIAGSAINELKAQFIDLKQTTPISWTELTNIGSLAGQLGIANDEVAGFTKTVAMFSATTGITVEQSATAFGRLAQLLPGVGDDFDKLGSSILAVGVNSVATEAQIIAISTQIASMANLAGFTADQIIGLSGALASVGIAPEAARGLTTRLFTEISTAITQSSVALENFGAVSGQTGAEFAAGWGSNASLQLVEFLKGIDAEGANAQATLAKLGITSVRDVPGILKLAQSHEEVAASLGIASSAYSKGDEIQRQYAVIMDTMASKLELLTGNFQLLFATSASGINILGGLLDVVNNLVVWLTDLAQNPIVGFLLSFGTAATAVAGLLAVITAGVIRAGAASAAYKLTTIELAVAQGVLKNSTDFANISIAEQTALLGKASGAGAALKSALSSGAILAAVGISVALLAEAFNVVTEAMKSSGDRAKETFGDFDALSTALKQDTAELNSNTSAADKSSSTFDTVTSSVDGATYAIGNHTKAVLYDALKADESYKKLIEYTTKLKEATGIGFDQASFTANIASGTTAGMEAAKAQIDELNKKVYEYSNNVANVGNLMNLSWNLGGATSAAYLTDAVNNGNNAIATFKVGLEEAANAANVDSAAMKAMGLSTDEATTDINNASTALGELRTAIDDAFAEQDVAIQFGNDIRSLFQGIADGGSSFNELSQAGSTNLQNLNSSIASTIQYGKILGMDASESVASLFRAMVDSGVANTDALVAYISRVQIPGVDAKAVAGFLSGSRQMTTAGTALTTTMNGVAGSVKKVGGAASSAAAKVVTLKDYASDLAKVFERAFQIRFDGMKSLDNIAKSFNDIAQATSDARAEIDSLNADVQSLQADQALQKYFLTVAEAYGDTLKAQEIRANLSKIDADLTSKTKSLQKAQDKTNKTLVGTSNAAIDNRSEIIGLVGEYQDYIKALAASGADQATLQAKSSQLKSEFIAQATQLGYNSSELGTYAAAFDDVSLAIANVPRNITVDANTDPAIQAWNELKAASDAAQRSAASYSGPPEFDSRGVRQAALQARIDASIAYLNELRRSGNARGAVSVADNQLAPLQRAMANGWYADGGYTGAGGKYDVAGIVHRGEYVVPKQDVNQTTGLPYFMSQMPKFYSGGATTGTGGGAMMVSLSPEDRALLRNVGGSGEVVLYANNEALARSVNTGNRSIVAAGGRP